MLEGSDGSRVLTLSGDDRPRLWDVTTGKQVGAPMRHDDRVRGAVFNADGSRVLSWSADGTARLWDISQLMQGSLFAVVCRRWQDHDLSSIVSKYGVRIEDPICAEVPPDPDWSRVE